MYLIVTYLIPFDERHGYVAQYPPCLQKPSFLQLVDRKAAFSHFPGRK